MFHARSFPDRSRPANGADSPDCVPARSSLSDPTRDARSSEVAGSTVPSPPVDRWCLVVPVKRLASAKTRLAAAARRAPSDLALAFALDTATAALASAAVARSPSSSPTTPKRRGRSPRSARSWSPRRPGRRPQPRSGARRARGRTGASRDRGGRVGRRPARLASRRARASRWPPRRTSARRLSGTPQGTGTTLLLAPAPVTSRPLSGRVGGARTPAAVPSNCTATRSRRCARTSTLPPTSSSARARAWVRTTAAARRPLRRRLPQTGDRIGAVQATVRSFSSATRAGTVLFDDGVELPYDAAAFDAGRLRLLRVGPAGAPRVEGEGAACASPSSRSPRCPTRADRHSRTQDGDPAPEGRPGLASRAPC